MIEIKHKLTGEVIYRYDGDSLRDVDLSYANLLGADLLGADLLGADLLGADLSDAVLRSAVLRSAVLRGADFRDADLCDADLSGANLSGANLEYANTDQRYITIGCIGRGKRQTTYCFDTDTVWCGCFMGTLEEFAAQVEETHKDNPQHLAEYRGAIAYIKSLQTSPDKSVS